MRDTFEGSIGINVRHRGYDGHLIGGEPGKLSVIQVMTDTNRRRFEKTVRHPGYDGHKSMKNRKNCPSSRL